MRYRMKLRKGSSTLSGKVFYIANIQNDRILAKKATVSKSEINIVEFKFEGVTLDPGDYRFVVYSRGGDAGGQLQSSFRKVKVIAGPTPPPRTKEITVSRVVYDSEAGGTFAIGEGFTSLKLVDGQRVMGYQTDELDVQPVEFESDTCVKLIAWDLPVDTTFFLQWQADPSATEYKQDSHTQQFTVGEA